jgi:hypothetical protein
MLKFHAVFKGLNIRESPEREIAKGVGASQPSENELSAKVDSNHAGVVNVSGTYEGNSFHWGFGSHELPFGSLIYLSTHSYNLLVVKKLTLSRDSMRLS